MFLADLAWAAGFFDAEGCFSSARRYPVATVHQVGLELIDIFATIVGLGKVYGPIRRDAAAWRRRPQWRHQIFGFEDVQALTCLLWPWLSAENELRLQESFCTSMVMDLASFPRVQP